MQVPGRYFFNNVANVINLLNAMVDHGVLRFVFSSSAGVYGEPPTAPIPEDAPIAPLNPYGESKALVERLLRWYDSQCGLCYASLRYFNAAGATERLGEDHRPETHLIPVVLEVALGKRQAIDIYGTDYPTPDGSCIRDYVHVSDLAQAHFQALERCEQGSAIYNLGVGQGFSNREVVETARRVTGHPIPAREAPRRPGDPATLVASAERARQQLGWEPRYTDLGEIIESAWRWHQAHPNGYEG
jgi:UDP-glucose 4-epimerase